MNKTTWIAISLSVVGLHCFGCAKRNTAETIEKEISNPPVSKRELAFASADKDLERTFYWAKSMALRYAHDGKDPVGYWYEAALPGRQAFCMRDMAHQSIGAEILGLSKHNENMLSKFVANISDSKDWCSYWEIDKFNKPAPVDYTDDDHFWYNLNANFDIIHACLKVYEWTGNDKLIKDPSFDKFYKISLNEYVKRWKLSPEEIMQRPRYLNVKDPAKNSHRDARGLPSYVENYPNLTASSDLIATLYAGFIAYSKIAAIRGDQAESTLYSERAKQYRDLLEDRWWDQNLSAYHTFWTSKNEFANGEGLTYILWFNATDRADRIRATAQKIMGKKDWNVENQSHFPALYYDLNYLSEAYQQLLALPTVARNAYPEVSYGALEGIIGGTMGIRPIFHDSRVETLPRMTVDNADKWIEIENLPVFDGNISVRHDNNMSSNLTNNTNRELIWRASFQGSHAQVTVDGSRKVVTKSASGKLGNKISYVDIPVPVGKRIAISVDK